MGAKREKQIMATGPSAKRYRTSQTDTLKNGEGAFFRKPKSTESNKNVRNKNANNLNEELHSYI